ncbi:MAG: ATP-binding protein, partial [Treponema sp.]|nr:ATP-binding protein [Treponema sp.]
MKNKIAVFLSCIFIFLNILYAQPVAAGETELPAVKVALTDDMSIIIYRILYEAVKRSGYQMIPQVTGMRTAITDVNYGGAAILALQTEDWEKRYDNLIKVPVIINNVEFIAYTRSGDTNTFSGWGDIAGLRLGYRWQNEYVVNNLHRTGADKFTAVTTYDELWRSLSNNETDVVILPANQHFEHKIPQGIRKAGVIDVLPCYTYINKKYAHLLPLLTNAYREMHADGTMELIYNSRKLSGEKEIILHINSYNTQIEWEYRHMETIRRTLSQDFQFEYRSIDLSSNELHSQAGFNTVITDLIRTDYIMRYPDLIIASGNEALEFVLNNYYVLFPKTPVVFFGTLGLNHSTLHGFESYITGISESISFHETVTQMLRLYPGTRRIFILNDGSLSRSRILREYIHDRIGTLGLQAEFIFNDDKPFPEILEDIRGFGQDTLVLIGNYLIDSGGASYSEKDVKKMVASASENPVFCMNAPYIGYGTLGGLVMCPDLQSGMVTSMAADILNGIHPAEIPAIFNSTTFNKWMFDHETVNRFSIKKYLLPQGHVIVNRLLPVWESNPHEFKLALALALLLLMIILGLILFSKMLAKKQKEAEAASRAKSAFLANMSHEIRTPMNSIIGFSELALDNRITPKTKEYLDMIIKNAKGLLQIINDILDISKIESGSVHLESIPFDLGELLESCRNIIQPKAKEKNINLRFYAEAPADKMLAGDPTRLRQVLVNLLFNAVKFTDSGCVKLTVLMNSETKNDVDLRFEVEDTGIGMTDEQITKIFEPFTQGDISTTRKYGGTGLGLTISKNILDLLDSKLEIHSIPGTGTIIAFNLTYKLTDAEGMLKQTTESPDAAGKTVKPRFTGNILVCEDNQMNQKVIAE